MLNLVQHLTKSGTYETLKQVQGDKSGLFTRPSILGTPQKTRMGEMEMERYFTPFPIRKSQGGQSKACPPSLSKRGPKRGQHEATGEI